MGWSSAMTTLCSSWRPGSGQDRLYPPAPLGGGAGVEGAAEQGGAFPHAHQAVARWGAAASGGAVVVDGQSYPVGVACDGDGDLGRVAGVPSSVGDGLLGQAVDRRPDRRAEVVELAEQRHLDAGTRLAIGGELLDLGRTGLRRELGVLGGAEHADDARSSVMVRVA